MMLISEFLHVVLKRNLLFD